MTGESYDVAVIGGGPGGSVAALAAARRGLRVVLYEPQVGPIDKVCGEGIMAAGVDSLRQLGLTEVVEQARAFDHIRYMIPGTRPMTIDLPEPGLAVERPRLQAALEATLASECSVRRIHERSHATRIEGGYLVSSNGSEIQARTLIVADGGGGATASWMRHETGGGTRLGVRARFEAAEELESVEVHLGGPCEIYLTPLPDNRVNAALLFNGLPTGVRGARALLDWGMDCMPGVQRVLGELHTAPASLPLGRKPPHTMAENGVFIIGDAGGGADPILGCGVTIAIRSGVAAACAAELVVQGDRSGRPERDYAACYIRETRARRALAATLRRLAPHARVMRGIATVGRLFPGTLKPLVGIVSGTANSAAA